MKVPLRGRATHNNGSTKESVAVQGHGPGVPLNAAGSVPQRASGTGTAHGPGALGSPGAGRDDWAKQRGGVEAGAPDRAGKFAEGT